MEIPPEIETFVKQHLGKSAIETQQRVGRGVWILTAADQANYILADDLHKVIGEGDAADIAEMHRLIETFDPKRQVVVLLNFSDDLQFGGIIDAIQ